MYVNSFRYEIKIKCTLYFHLYCKSYCLWRNLHRLQKFYTAAGSDGIDKFHLCMHIIPFDRMVLHTTGFYLLVLHVIALYLTVLQL